MTKHASQPLTASLGDLMPHPDARLADLRRALDNGPFECPMCPRRNLVDRHAFWAHIRTTHLPSELIRYTATLRDDTFEEILIRIANSVTHEEAVNLATSALLGSALREG